MNRFQLDIAQEKLFGWEHSASIEVVAALAHELIAGNKLPPVPIQRFGSNNYLCMESIDEKTGLVIGGHNRAVAAYITNTPLDCIESAHAFAYRKRPIAIPDITLESRPVELKQRAAYHPAYKHALNKQEIDYRKLNI